MENRLKKLFDFQRFESSPELASLIRETENRYPAELSDNDLAFVNAAGEGLEFLSLNADDIDKKLEK